MEGFPRFSGFPTRRMNEFVRKQPRSLNPAIAYDLPNVKEVSEKSRPPGVVCSVSLFDQSRGIIKFGNEIRGVSFTLLKARSRDVVVCTGHRSLHTPFKSMVLSIVPSPSSPVLDPSHPLSVSPTTDDVVPCRTIHRSLYYVVGRHLDGGSSFCQRNTCMHELRGVVRLVRFGVDYEKRSLSSIKKFCS